MGKIDKKEYAMSCIQLNVILSNLSEKEKIRIPYNILNEINKYKSNKYIYKYDFSKTLLEQEMLPLTKELLNYIYTKYVETKEPNNRIFFEYNYYEDSKEAKKEKYNLDNLFKNKNQNSTEETKHNEENTNMIVVKEEKWYKKIFILIKNSFKKVK